MSVKLNRNLRNKLRGKFELVQRSRASNAPVATECYNVSNGFMLANEYYIHGTSEGRIDPTGWWFSEKYDGVRAIWNGVDFFTRNLTKIAVPAWFKAKMPKNLALDGEFFIKRNYFDKTSGIVRRKIPMDKDWEPIRFMVIDAPSLYGLTLEERFERLYQVIGTISLPLVLINQTKILNKEHLMNMHQNIVSAGAEGSIIRAPLSFYVPRRCDSLLKIKDQNDEDATIVDWKEGQNRNTGKLGALFVRWVDPKKIQQKYQLDVFPDVVFKVGSGFTDLNRCPFNEASQWYPKGDVIKVGFYGLKASGKPRHPAFKGIREK